MKTRPSLLPASLCCIFAGASIADAQEQQIVNTAQAALTSARALCNEPDACDQTIWTRISELDAATQALVDVIPTGDLGRIEQAINGMRAPLLNVCNSIVDPALCGQLSGGTDGLVVPKKREVENIEPAGISCESRCERAERECRDYVQQQIDACVRGWDNYFACWIRVPYPPGQPFPQHLRDEFAQSCSSFVAQGRMPAQRCTECPQSEREGGCPSFFVEPYQICPLCTFMRCETNPSLCSCRRQGPTTANWNFTQCDLCRWANIGATVSNLSKTSFCNIRQWEDINECVRLSMGCIKSCHIFE